MPLRGFTNPPPKTDSAREARKSFFCELCQKGYARQNEYSAHLSSYDHQHKQRLKDLKAMNRVMDASLSSKSRSKTEEGGAGVMKIQPIAMKKGAASGGFKKGGFKSAFGGGAVEGERVVVKSELADEGVVDLKRVGQEVGQGGDESEDEGYECYDPRRPTGCGSDCSERV